MRVCRVVGLGGEGRMGGLALGDPTSKRRSVEP